jgi:ligand-binding sensor domain-containing protein
VSTDGEHHEKLEVHVEGVSRDLAPLVRDDVYRIVCEALRNAHRHASATRIEVEVHYAERQLRVRIRDDGEGIDPTVLHRGARAGHFGLPGIHERADALGGTLTVWSERNAGTRDRADDPGVDRVCEGVCRTRSRAGTHMKRVAVLLACTLLSWGGRAFALDPALDVSQYAHTAWKNRDGFAKGAILTIAQPPDGYLWLGTELGLLRFDGVRTVPFQPPEGQRLPSNDIRRLLSTADGTLWIGTTEGLASWKDGTLTVYPALTGLNVIRVLQDRDGSIWIGTLNSSGAKLCVLTAAKVQCVGEDGRFGRGVFGLLQDSKGVLWVGTDNGVWRWRPGPPQFYPLPITVNGIQGLAEDGDGSLLITVDNTLWRLAAGTPRRDRTLPTPPQIQANRLLRDRDGGVGVGTSGGGVIHMHEGRTEVFGETDGLSDNHVLAFHEDREGNVWVATSGGLDRFREFAAAIVSDEQGFSISLGQPPFCRRLTEACGLRAARV